MSAKNWMLPAPATGRAIEMRPMAKFRCRWKKLTASVRGTTEMRIVFPSPRAMIYPMENWITPPAPAAAKKADAREQRRGGHHPAGAVAVGERADEGRYSAAYPGAGGHGVGDGAAVPAHVFEYEVLYAAEHHLRDARGPNGGHGRGAQYEPAVVEGRAGPPVVEPEYQGHGPPGCGRPALRRLRGVDGPHIPTSGDRPGEASRPGRTVHTMITLLASGGATGDRAWRRGTRRGIVAQVVEMWRCPSALRRVRQGKHRRQ